MFRLKFRLSTILDICIPRDQNPFGTQQKQGTLVSSNVLSTYRVLTFHFQPIIFEQSPVTDFSLMGGVTILDKTNFIDCCLLGQEALLYLSTQTHFLIGGQPVTCHWSKLTDSLGQTKLTNSPGIQERVNELLTRM